MAAEGIFPATFGQLADCAWVSRAFETSERSEVVDWSHYRAVAKLAGEDKPAAIQLIDRIEREGLSVRDTKREVQALKAANDPGSVDERVIDEPRPRSLSDVEKAAC